MTSTYTANNGLEKPEAGDQEGTWGGTLNTNFDIIDRVLSGVGSVSLSGTTHTLTTTDGTLTDGMYRVLLFTGALGANNTVTISPNDQDKLYFIVNNTTDSGSSGPYSIIIKQGTGATVTVENGRADIVYADGAGSGAAVVSLGTEIGQRAFDLYTYTATAGQTTFTGSDTSSKTLAYSVYNLFVTLNGVTLENGTDYTATNGTSVVLTDAATVDDELNIYAFNAFSVANVTAAGGDFSIGDDLSFTSDGAVISFGADNDVTLTHVHDTGIKLNSTLHLEKSDATAYDATDSDGQVSVGPTIYLENPANANNTVGGQIVFGMRSTEAQARIGATGGTSPALVFGTADAERMRIDSNGHVLPAADSTYDLGANATRFRQAYIDEIDIGSNTGLAASAANAMFVGYAGGGSEYAIEVKTDASTGVAMYFLHSTTTACGSISVGSSATAFNTSSDYRLKENVSDMSGAITRLKNLKPKRFNWISDENNELLDGFLAHEVDAVVPQAIHGEKDATKDGEPVYQGIDQSKLVPLLTGALQEAIAKIETLETKVAALES